MTTVLVLLAEGFEELEAITIVDLLRRAGIEVITAGLESGPVQASRKTTVIPDKNMDEALKQEYDMVVLPGGQPGATHLEQDKRVIKLLQNMASQKKYIAAICAAPKVLASAGILDNRQATGYPGTLDIQQFPQIKVSHGAVVVDGNIVTSRGPGTAMDFALKLIEVLAGKAKRDEVDKGLVRPIVTEPS